MLRDFFRRPIFKNPSFVGFAWFATVVVACLLKLPAGKTFNNYVIYRMSFWHALDLKNLYDYYPNEYHDRFLYGIPFTAIVAPFSILPPYIGMLLWCVANSLLLYMAIRKLGLEKWKHAFVIWMCLNELYTCVLMQQFNIAVAGMILLSFMFIERKQEFWAAFMIVLGTMTKIYGIVGLAFFLFSKRRIAFLKGLLFWGIALYVFPMLYTSPGYVADEYVRWFDTIMDKNTENMFTPYTNISLLGMVRKISGVYTYSDLWLVIPGLFLFVSPYFRINQYEYRQFRTHFLCSVLLFMVLFSTGTENSGYMGAMVAVCLWYISTPTHKTTPTLNTILFVFCFILTSLSPTDLFPRFVRINYVIPYALKALPCILIWFKIVWEQLTLDFSGPLPHPLTLSKQEKSIDIILPCYNPQAGWERRLIRKHAELKQLLSDRPIRFIVVNDASARGFTDEAVKSLQDALPDTIIVDNQVNKGKGAAVRAGLSHSSSEITLYTDYDFPYQVESIQRMVGYLEEGYDVVIATRNHTYYTHLSTKRKIMSYASRILNFTILGLTHTDTQGGLKGFNQKGKQLLASTRVDRFLFDTEFIYKASLQPDVVIKDMPADLRENVHLPNMRRGVLAEELKNLFLIAWRG